MALLLIDIQEGFHHPTYWGPSRSNPSFEANVESILKAYRSLVSTNSQDSSPHKIIHIAHASQDPFSLLAPTSPGFNFQSFVTPLPTELVITKNVKSAFIGTNLEEVLRKHFDGKSGMLYLVGLTTDHCISTSTRMAGNLGVADGKDGEEGEVVFIEDATAAWKKSEDGFEAEVVHKVNAKSLQEFASVVKAESVLESWKVWEEEKQ